MKLSKELVEEFQIIILKKFGEEIDYEVAEFQLTELADLVRLTSQDKN